MSGNKKTKAAKQSTTGPKRAAIYVRVSSEKQAKTKGGDGQEAEEKESPQAQERDCRALAERQGYVVVKVYRDTEKYRVGKKLVEPSGTRSDRPGLRAMLADARKGDFDVILAWREDRLYRSYRPMLDVLDCLEETGLDIELAKETFDKNLAPVKAWAARMELAAKHDRMMMGVAGRLAEGKAWSCITPYGYAVKDSHYVINDSEAQWVTMIWRLYAEGVSVNEIRRRLIAAGAKQRKENRKRKPWAINYIRQILHQDYFHTGKFQVTWDGITYGLPMPVIVDAETTAQVKQNLTRYKAYPAGNLQAKALAAGVVYCQMCNVKMSVINTRAYNRDRSKVYRYLAYQCTCVSKQDSVPGCAGKVKMSKLDGDVWKKLYKELTEPGELEATIQRRVAELQVQQFDASDDCERIQKRLDDLAMMRQESIAWAQAKIITKADMELRLSSLSFEQVELERVLRDKRLLVGNHAERLIEVARKYRESVLGGVIDANKEPESPEEAAEIFKARRDLVETYVKRVDVLPDKSTRVELDFNFAKVLGDEDLRISDTPAYCESRSEWDRPSALAGQSFQIALLH